MTKAKKRPSKTAKTAAKLLSDSKLLAAQKAAKEAKDAQESQPDYAPTHTAGAIKPRPNKKRG